MENIYLHGFLVDIDKFNRAKIIFPDDYNNLDKLSFTKSFVLQKCKTLIGGNPVLPDKKGFYVKCNKHQIGYMGEKLAPLKDFIQHEVRLFVKIKQYNFKKNGTSVVGWNINLDKMILDKM